MTLYEKVESHFIKNSKLNFKAKIHAVMMFGKRNLLKSLFAKDITLQKDVAKRMLATNNLTYKEYAQFLAELNNIGE